MKINLLNPPHEESLDTKLDPPLGLLYIAAVLKKEGHEVSVTDLNFYTRSTWPDIIPHADIYGISVMTASLHHAVNLRDIVRKINPVCRIIVGGAHPTSMPMHMVDLGFDAVVVGEGEKVINDVVKYLRFSTNKGGIFHSNVDINTIPIPARELVPLKEYTRLVDGKPATSMIASRGCPYSCSFCVNSIKKSKVRFRTTQNIIEELIYLVERQGFRSIMFLDDTFTVHPHLNHILEEISKMNITFRCNGNARRDQLKTFKKLYQAGCREISFGIESGSQMILDKINKRVTVEQNRRAILDAKEARLTVRAYLMVGSPGESWDTIKETISFIDETKPNLWTLFNFVPLPGCAIWEDPTRYGIKIVTKDWRQYYNIAGKNSGGLTVATEHMTPDDIAKARQYMLDHLTGQTGHLQDYYKKL